MVPALTSIAAFLVGVSKTGITGLVILPIAMFAGVLPARESVGVALAVLVAGDVMAVLMYRHDAQWSHLWRLFPWTAAGVVAGAITIGQIDDSGIRRLIGIVLIVLLSIHFARQAIKPKVAESGGEAVASSGRYRWVVPITGVLAGFTTMVANASGPIMVLYLLAQGLSKTKFIGTAAWFFLLLNLFKVPFAIGLDLITPSSVVVSLRVIPFTALGAILGHWILQRLNQQRFEHLALGLTWIASLRLVM